MTKDEAVAFAALLDTAIPAVEQAFRLFISEIEDESDPHSLQELFREDMAEASDRLDRARGLIRHHFGV